MQEWQAEQSAHALQTMIKKSLARVRRAGHQMLVDSEEVVPGDIVLLESGDRVPADMRLLQVNNLTPDEAFLTGLDRTGWSNRAAPPSPKNTPLSERVNMAYYAGSTVLTGRGVGVWQPPGLTPRSVRLPASSKKKRGCWSALLVIRMEALRPPNQRLLIVLGFAGLLGVILLCPW